jgi:hypothetical protein
MPLGDEASAAFQRFRREARTLGTISHAFEVLGASLTAAYYAALAAPSPAAWSTLVGRAAAFVERAHVFDGILPLDDREREALEFFEAIVRENGDLLAADDAISSVELGASMSPIAAR